MKVYVATSYKNRRKAREAIKMLTAAGHKVTEDWTRKDKCAQLVVGKRMSHARFRRVAYRAIKDLNGVMKCDALVMLTKTSGRGMYVELGAALAAEKLVILVTKPRHLNCIFYFMPNIIMVRTMREALEVLGTYQLTAASQALSIATKQRAEA